MESIKVPYPMDLVKLYLSNHFGNEVFSCTKLTSDQNAVEISCRDAEVLHSIRRIFKVNNN
jgi:hypothetical protein